MDDFISCITNGTNKLLRYDEVQRETFHNPSDSAVYDSADEESIWYVCLFII